MTTAHFNKTVNAVSAAEFPLMLLQIDHTALAEPIRVVNDRQDVTSNGSLFQAAGFEVTMPTQPETGAPTAQLRVDNVSRNLVYWVEQSHGARGAIATLSQVLRSDPDTVEWSVTLNLANISIDNLYVSAILSYDDLWNAPACSLVYRPDTAPGLF